MEEKLLAFCGLYCGDCAGYSGEIANAAKALLCILKKYNFTRTARYLFSDELTDMDVFLKKLTFMTTLRCNTVCRLKTDNETKCRIRACCCKKGFYACYECDMFERCETLMHMQGVHGDSCVKNLRAIKALGLEQWLRKGNRQWFDEET